MPVPTLSCTLPFPMPHMCLPLVARAQQKQVTISQGDAHSHHDARGYWNLSYKTFRLSSVQHCRTTEYLNCYTGIQLSTKFEWLESIHSGGFLGLRQSYSSSTEGPKARVCDGPGWSVSNNVPNKAWRVVVAQGEASQRMSPTGCDGSWWPRVKCLKECPQ